VLIKREIIPVEIKSEVMFSSAYLKGLKYWHSLITRNDLNASKFIIYNGYQFVGEPSYNYYVGII